MAQTSLRRRQLLALTAAGVLQACASVPDADHYLPTPTMRTRCTPRRAENKLDGSPLLFGNRPRLLRDGAQALPAMFQAMQQARDHINLEYFIFEDVRSAATLSDLLIDRLGHVAVNIIYDAYGSQATPAELFDALRKAGARSSSSIRSTR